jgi:hypothetical protein
MTDEKFRLEAVVEQSITRRRKKANNFDNNCPVMDHECRHFRSEREMCRYWGITSETYRYRRKHGLDKKTALTLPPLWGRRKSYDGK